MIYYFIFYCLWSSSLSHKVTISIGNEYVHNESSFSLFSPLPLSLSPSPSLPLSLSPSLLSLSLSLLLPLSPLPSDHRAWWGTDRIDYLLQAPASLEGVVSLPNTSYGHIVQSRYLEAKEMASFVLRQVCMGWVWLDGFDLWTLSIGGRYNEFSVKFEGLGFVPFDY